MADGGRYQFSGDHRDGQRLDRLGHSTTEKDVSEGVMSTDRGILSCVSELVRADYSLDSRLAQLKTIEVDVKNFIASARRWVSGACFPTPASTSLRMLSEGLECWLPIF